MNISQLFSYKIQLAFCTKLWRFHDGHLTAPLRLWLNNWPTIALSIFRRAFHPGSLSNLRDDLASLFRNEDRFAMIIDLFVF